MIVNLIEKTKALTMPLKSKHSGLHWLLPAL